MFLNQPKAGRRLSRPGNSAVPLLLRFDGDESGDGNQRRRTEDMVHVHELSQKTYGERPTEGDLRRETTNAGYGERLERDHHSYGVICIVLLF